MQDRFDAEIFAPLTEHGVERDALQLAWDFTTGTQENAAGPLLKLRDAMLEQIGEEGPGYTITNVEETPEHPWTDRIITGIAHVPSFLLPPTELGLRRVRWGEDGAPVFEGTEDIEFLYYVPKSVVEAGEPGGLMQYGHGFLGRRGEANNGWIREMGNRFGFSHIAVNMQGMDQTDTAYWGANLNNDPASFPWVTEKAMQGILNQMAVVRMMKGRFLLDEDPRLTLDDGQPLYDPERVYYYGNSQGGTIGSIVMATTPDMPRGVLGVPGCCYPILVHRSTVFDAFLGLLRGAVPDLTDLSVFLSLIGGTGMRYIDPLSYAPQIIGEPFPGTIRHEVLLHVAKEDAQVHNEVSYMLGRAIGVPLATPALRTVFGLDERPYPFEGSALVEYDFSVPEDVTPLDPPLDENDTHGSLRKQREGQQQMMHFLETGEMIDTCGGPCVFAERPE